MPDTNLVQPLDRGQAAGWKRRRQGKGPGGSGERRGPRVVEALRGRLKPVGDFIAESQRVMLCARAPLLTATALCLALVLPDQTVEVVRATHQGRRFWDAVSFGGWIVALCFTAWCLGAYAKAVFLDTPKLSRKLRHAVIWLLLLAPPAAAVAPVLQACDVLPVWAKLLCGLAMLLALLFVAFLALVLCLGEGEPRMPGPERPAALRALARTARPVVNAGAKVARSCKVRPLTEAGPAGAQHAAAAAAPEASATATPADAQAGTHAAEARAEQPAAPPGGGGPNGRRRFWAWFWGLFEGRPDLKVILAASLLFLAYIGVIAGVAACLDWNWELPPLLLLTGWTVLLLGLLAFANRLTRWIAAPVITLLALLLVGLTVFDLNDNHVLVDARGAGHPWRTEAEKSPLKGQPPDAAAAFREWLNGRPDLPARQDVPYTVALVAAEGGGARAAYMTALVLEELRHRCPWFQRHFFAAVGVSGGSVGAALASQAAREAGPPAADSPPCPEAQPGSWRSERSAAIAAAGADLLRPLLRGALLADLPMRFLPSGIWTAVTSTADRARFLEHGIDVAWREAASGASPEPASLRRLPFSDAAPKAGSPDVPALVLLATDVGSGRRVAVSHLGMPGGGPRPDKDCKRPEAPATHPPAEARAKLLSLAELAPGLDISLASAAVVSARFPLLTPAATVPCGDRPRLVDGGYFENSGLTTALDLMDAIGQGARDAGRKVRVVLLRIENSDATTDRRSRAGEPPEPPDRFLSELGSPVRAFLGTRGARADLARRTVDRAADAGRWCRAGQDCIPFAQETVRLRPCHVAVPLGWSLSEGAREEIRRQVLGTAQGGEDTDGTCKAGGVPHWPDQVGAVMAAATRPAEGTGK